MSAAPAILPSNLAVARVETKADREAFIRFQWEIYRGNPSWVPPLLMERRDFLNPKKNPFFKHADVELFLARRDGRVVGRIAAIEDRNYNKFHGTRICSWGLWEQVDDAAVADALFAKVREFGKARGLDSMLGPLNLSTNYDCGLLVDSFDRPPYLLMTYNPPWYERLLFGAGHRKAKDLWAWDIDVKEPVPERITRLADRIRRREDLVVRPIELKDLHGEIDKIKRIYNEAWEKNWGAVPMTDDEFHHMAKDMKQLVEPSLFLMAEVKGEPVAFAMTLPDINRALAKIDGRLFPFGLVKLLWHARKIKACRLIALGIRKEYRKRGIDAVLYHDTKVNAQKLGFTEGEVSWTLEDNDLINRAIESMGAKRSKTYRLYEANV